MYIMWVYHIFYISAVQIATLHRFNFWKESCSLFTLMKIQQNAQYIIEINYKIYILIIIIVYYQDWDLKALKITKISKNKNAKIS